MLCQLEVLVGLLALIEVQVATQTSVIELGRLLAVKWHEQSHPRPWQVSLEVTRLEDLWFDFDLKRRRTGLRL